MKKANNLYVLLFFAFMILLPTGIQFSYSQGQDLSTGQVQSNSTNATNTPLISNSQTLLLEDTTLPQASYLHLYDSSPYKIMNSHIAAKIPCNDDYTTPIIFLFGPDIQVPLDGLALSPLLSQAGGLCMYKGDIIGNGTTNFTDIAIYNNSTDDIVFPPTSTINIRVNEVSPQLNNTIQ